MAIMILKLQKLKEKETLAKRIISNEIMQIKMIDQAMEKFGDDFDSICSKGKGLDIALDLLEIKSENLRGEVYDMVYDIAMNEKNRKIKAEVLTNRIFKKLIPHVEKYMKSEKIYY